ncbi:MAG: type 4a pilus biogenesis protein PilO [Coriobacteriia bacterium]|nr:type 4a pilus biogenesis protein PilO [Coriobacteriia bacterium]
MGRLSAQNQMYIAIAVITVVALAIVFLVIVPLFQEATGVDATIQTEEGNLAAAEALLARRQSAKAQSAADEVELMRIANEIPESPQLPSVIIELQDVANASGVDLIALKPEDLQAGNAETEGGVSDYSAVPITLTLEGDWAEYIDLFRRIEALDRGVRVVTTTFSYVPETDTAPAYVAATIGIEVYVMAAVESKAAPEAVPSEATTQTP